MPTLTVTSLENDVSNTGSLVYAILQANAGVIDSIAISSSLNGETFDFSTLTSLNGTSEESLTAINVDYGTVSGLSGSLSATGGTAYGMAGFGNQNGKALELTGFTGSVTVTASGEAIGVLSRNTGNPATQTLNVAASTGTVTVESTGGNAYGLAADSSSGRSGQNTASLAFDSMGLDITVTATDTAYGLYSRAACSFTYYDTASHNKAIASMDTGGLTGTIRVTGAKAYGLYVAADVSLSRTASLTVGDITGELTVAGGDAYGMCSSHDITFGNLSTGAITVSATENAYGLYAGGNLTGGDYALDISGSGNVYGFYAVGDISVVTPISSALRLHGGDNGNLFGVYSENGKFSSEDYSGEFSLSANGSGKVTLVRAYELAVTDFSGSFAATAENGVATALEGSIGMVSGLTGSLSATGNTAYGMAGFGSQNGKALELASFTGSVTVTASGEAIGVLSRNTGNPATQTLNVAASTGTVTVESTGGNAYGLAADSSFGRSGQNTASLAFDSMGLDITVTATDTAYGLYSRAACSFTYYDTASHNKAIASMDMGGLTGTIRVTGAKAYGLYVAADVSLSRTASLTVGDITGELTVTATGGDGYGMYSSHNLTVGDFSSTSITVTATANAYGLYAGGDISVAAPSITTLHLSGGDDANVYGIYSENGTINLDDLTGELSLSTTGNGNVTLLHGKNLSINATADTFTVSAEDGEATIIESSGGTLSALTGTLSATGRSAYGVKSSPGTLSVENFTGVITATASTGEAAGFAGVYAGAATGGLSFTGLSGDITASSDGGDAYGILSRHGGSGGYSSAVSTIIADELSAHVTVTATGLAAGVYSRAAQLGYYTSSSSEVSLGDVSGFITVTGGSSAYGVYSGAYDAGSRNATLTTGDITGTISVSASEGDAYGLYSSHSMTVGDISAEAISVTASTGIAAGLYAIGNLTVGHISSNAMSLDGVTTQYGLYSGGNLTVEVIESDAFDFNGASDRYGLYAGGALSIPAFDASLEISTSGSALVTVFRSGTVAIDSFTGSLSVSSESGGATALEAVNGGTLKEFEGTMTATGGSAYGVKSSSGTLSVNSFTGEITATASSGEAAGFASVNAGSSTGVLSFTGLSGDITVSSDGGDAYGIISRHGGSSSYGSGISTVTADGLSAHVTVTATGLAAGVYSQAVQSGYYTSGSSEVSLGDVSGFITVTGGNSAYGVYSGAFYAGSRNATLTVSDITGTISVTASGGDAYGLYSSHGMTVGDISAEAISVTGSTGSSAGLYAGGNMTVGNIVPGAISINGAGTQYGLYAGGNLTVGRISSGAFSLGNESTQYGLYAGGNLSIEALESEAFTFQGADNIYGLYAGGAFTIPTLDVPFEVSATDGAAMALHAGTIAVDSFTGSLSASSESGEAAALNAENGGTLKAFEGTITATGGSAYGVKSSSGTLSIEGFTGSVTVTASTGEAAGFTNVYSGGAGGAGGYSFTGFTGSITVTSDAGDAFGIFSSRTGRSYSYYQQAVSTVAVDGLAGNITVTAAGLAAGVYSRASQTGYNPSTATSDVSLGDVTGFITVTGGSSAFGIYSAAYDSHNNTSSLAIGDMTGTISVSVSDGDAYGLFSSGSIQTGVLSGVLSVSSENGDAWLVRANGNATIGGFAEGFSATVTAGSGKTATGFSAGGVLTIPVWDVSFEASVDGDCNATALYGGTVAIDSFTGSLAATSESGSATALNAENGGTLKAFEGTITASGGSAYGVKSSSATLTVEGFTGTVKATASTGEAAGFANVYEGGNGGTGGYSFTGFAGSITATSDVGDAFGILSRRTGRSYSYYQQAVSTVAADGLAGNITVTAKGLAAGVYSRASQTGYYPATASSDVSLGDVTGFITVTGGSAAYGIYSAAYDSHNNSSSLAVGNMTGTISVSASDGPTYGLFSSGGLTITGNISSDVYVSSGNDVAAFLSGSKTMLRSGTKTIIVKEAVIDEETGEELSPEETVEQQLTMDVSGSIVVDGYSGAYAILASGDSNVSISGIVAAGSFQISSSEDKESLLENLKNMTRGESPLPSLESLGYAYADGWLNNGNFMATSSQDDLAIAEGALILGRIALGGGENNLTIDSGAKLYGDITADSLNLAFNLNTLQEDVPVITAQQAGALSSSNTEWTINIADGLQSGRYLLAKVEGGLDAEEMAEFSVTVNTTDENHEITFADRLDKIGFADINVTEDGEIEFIYSDTFWVIDHNLKDNLISTLNNGSITLRFGGVIDEAAFSLDMVTMTDGNGNAVAFTNYTIDIDRLTLEYDPFTVEGTYTLEVSNTIRNTDGEGLDQNRNKIAGEADDGYCVQLAVDVSRPYVTDVTLEADAAGSPAILKVYFSENVKPETLAGNVKLLAMNGTEMMSADMQLLDNCLELTILDEAGDKFSLQILEGVTDFAGNALDSGEETGIYEWSSVVTGKPEHLVATADQLSWSPVKNARQYVVDCSTDNFEHFVRVTVPTTSLDSFQMPSGSYQWRVQAVGSDEWAYGEEIVADAQESAPQLVESNENGIHDLFFATGSDIWNGNYDAQHVGIGEWNGTEEVVALNGKNQITDIFAGSDDASILLMTDDENGDALFIDDIYSTFPEGLDAQARIANIDEIRAGAGDDIVDLTSQRFDYVGGGMTVKGGFGDDVIWANNGDNTLFGDAGNDRIVGAGGNDVIVGGSGDDSLHGGGGDDIFAFGGDWGNDSVEQLADGKVTLWFDDGDESKWDASMLTYRDGDKSVAVSGVTAENISLKFGDDGSEQYGKLLESGAFDEFGSERIFENKNTRGMLA